MRAFVLLGGNVGNTVEYCQAAVTKMERLPLQITALSHYYCSEAWGFKASQPFINQVIEIETDIIAQALLSQCLSIETELGRVRNTVGSYESRVIDIDLLLYGNMIIHTTNLTLPHPRLHLRRFTLLPLSALAPDFVHPTLHKNIQTLLDECQDCGVVKKIE